MQTLASKETMNFQQIGDIEPVFGREVLYNTLQRIEAGEDYQGLPSYPGTGRGMIPDIVRNNVETVINTPGAFTSISLTGAYNLYHSQTQGLFMVYRDSWYATDEQSVFFLL